jgi:methylenetetrahydrofolate dehydrogenase (NADP+)/methenyltetrahydrofolate cyclohydrolase
MTAQILDGKAIAAGIRNTVKQQVEKLVQRGTTPGLAVVLVGDNPASQVYVRMKEKACDSVGIRSTKHLLPANATQSDLDTLIERLNADPQVHGILVQLPLPAGLDTYQVMRLIDPKKDIDGFHPDNVGRLCTGEGDGFIPCTPAGIMELIRQTQRPLTGAKAVVIGRSNIVGKPIAMLLLQANATVKICHSRSADLAAECQSADVLVSAVGRPGLVRGDWIKPGAIVIDVGTSRTADGSLAGDVCFDEAVKVAGFITPVPGGVGPMTIAMLLANTVIAAERS